LGHQAETSGKKPGNACGDDKSEAGHEEDGSEHEHGNFHVRVDMTEQEEAGAEQTEHDTDLKRREDTGDSVGDTHVIGTGIEVDGERGSFKEAPARLSLHVGMQFCAGGELVDQLSVNVHLQLEDAAPAAIFEELPNKPEQSTEDAREDEERPGFFDEPSQKGTLLRGLIELRPDGAFEGLIGVAVAVREPGEEVEVGIEGDFRMAVEELGELRVVAANVVLVGQESGVVFDDGGEGGAEPEELDELLLRCRHVSVCGDGRR